MCGRQDNYGEMAWVVHNIEERLFASVWSLAAIELQSVTSECTANAFSLS